RVAMKLDRDVRTAVRVSTYGDLAPGQVGLVVDSYGLVSIAVDRGSAAGELRLQPGAPVVLAAPS
ncbi:MAG TPA: SAM hydroxide adenosyltransferase, partial [Acidimicrobiales bacterium]|nr:SAM hydroxide adenosyltransferase [Acidimicrobiales bacterium]